MCVCLSVYLQVSHLKLVNRFKWNLVLWVNTKICKVNSTLHNAQMKLFFSQKWFIIQNSWYNIFINFYVHLKHLFSIWIFNKLQDKYFLSQCIVISTAWLSLQQYILICNKKTTKWIWKTAKNTFVKYVHSSGVHLSALLFKQKMQSFWSKTLYGFADMLRSWCYTYFLFYLLWF